jgi:hypothetical protein
LDTPLIYLEALLKVLVLFEKLRVVDNYLSIGDLEFQDLVIGSFRGFDGPQRFFKINVERP